MMAQSKSTALMALQKETVSLTDARGKEYPMTVADLARSILAPKVFANFDPDSLRRFVQVMRQSGADPLLGEISPMPFWSKAKNCYVVEPFLSVKYFKRRATDQNDYDGIVVTYLNDAEKAVPKWRKEQIVAVEARLYRKGHDLPVVATVTLEEVRPKDLSNTGDNWIDPAKCVHMLEVRAKHRAFAEAYPPSSAMPEMNPAVIAKGLAAEQRQQEREDLGAVAEEDETIVDGEFEVVDEEPEGPAPDEWGEEKAAKFLVWVNKQMRDYPDTLRNFTEALPAELQRRGAKSTAYLKDIDTNTIMEWVLCFIPAATPEAEPLADDEPAAFTDEEIAEAEQLALDEGAPE